MVCNDVFSISSHYEEQAVSMEFTDGDDSECITNNIVLSREDALYLGTTLLAYAKQLELSEDDYWKDEDA